jgi:hypothetical protein
VNLEIEDYVSVCELGFISLVQFCQKLDISVLEVVISK